MLSEKFPGDEPDFRDLYLWEQEDKGTYGFVRVRNPHYLQDGDDRKYIIRKPNPVERRDIIVNTVIECNGRTFRIPVLAKRLGVSDRTVQIVLRDLEREGLIEIVPTKTRRGAQRGNAYRYIGPLCEKYGSGLTLQILYDADQDVGFRNWDWKPYAFCHDSKVWHSAYPRCCAKFEQRIARREYLEKNNLPPIVPEKIKYLVLRHCYWKGDKRRLKKFLFSKDGAIKLPLLPLGRMETVTLFGHTMSVFFGGEIDNPQITISDMDTGQQLAIFTWFDANIIHSEKESDKRKVEQYFIIGDFTTK